MRLARSITLHAILMTSALTPLAFAQPSPRLTPIDSISAVAPESRSMIGDWSATVFGAGALGADNLLFAPTVVYDPGGSLSQTLAIADLNGDKYPDVVVTSLASGPSGQGAVGVLLGNGDGTFRAVTSYAPGTNCSPLSVAVGDLNGDGHPDVVTANTGCVAVFLGSGSGKLQPAVTYATGGWNAGSGPDVFDPVMIADVNHDGKPDVIVLNQTNQQYGDGSIGVLLGNGDGTLQPVIINDTGGFLATSFALADVNGDGNLDLVVPNCGSTGTTDCSTSHGNVAVLLGNGDGTFQPAKIYDAGGAGSFASPVVLVDLNGDGNLDIVVGNSCTAKKKTRSCAVRAEGTIGVLLGKGDGTFKPAKTYDCGGSGVTWMKVVDIDGDGKLDVVVTPGSTNVLRGNGDGTFRTVDRYPSGSGAVSVADLNGDGKLDLIAANITSNTVTALLGNGSGFSGPTFFNSGGTTILSDLAVQDLNGDGRPDLLTVSWCDPSQCVPGGDEEGALGVLLANPAFVNNGTTTTLASNANPVSPNQVVTYTVTVTRPGGGPLSGTVSFSHNGRPSSPVNLVNNQASINIDQVHIGTYGIQATYSGDANNEGSTSLTFEEYVKVLPVASKTTLTTSQSPTHVGSPVTFTATVTSQFGNIPDGETVSFSTGNTTLGTGSTAHGIATLTTTFAQARTYVIKAAYSGDDDFAPSSNKVKEVVKP